MNPSLRRLSEQKRAEARERRASVPSLVCDQAKKHIGFEGPRIALLVVGDCGTIIHRARRSRRGAAVNARMTCSISRGR
jgi:hypothetical protein